MLSVRCYCCCHCRLQLGFAECPKSYVFNGNKDYDAQKVSDLLGLGRSGTGAMGVTADGKEERCSLLLWLWL